ncbi:MAG TPA: S-methyl-5'-thioinosine phosphorylase [Gammaproteobacteria bacterium]|nr:S-methyl-5'-thioinosine phosphorylase [Gammaproteobacteria bacterium]
MAILAIIGGTGLDALGILQVEKREVINTPFGEPSGPVTRGILCGQEVLFLPRHGYDHHLPPHQVNYRANLWALRSAGAEQVLAVAAVGGIHADMDPGRLVIPDQIIDYTWGRPSTFFEDGFEQNGEGVVHIDFTEPYCQTLRQQLLSAARTAGIEVHDGGTYGATQGPRLETAAEIARMERDGCHLVGMTGMPEAALARELALCYATCAVVANRAAGKAEGVITMAEIEANLKGGMQRVGELLESLMPLSKLG